MIFHFWWWGGRLGYVFVTFEFVESVKKYENTVRVFLKVRPDFVIHVTNREILKLNQQFPNAKVVGRIESSELYQESNIKMDFGTQCRVENFIQCPVSEKFGTIKCLADSGSTDD